MGGDVPGYRLILTLEINVDMKHQLILNTHAITCHQEFQPSSYRRVYESAGVTGADIMESVHSVRGVSLDWDEFNETSVLARVELFTKHEDIEESVSDEIQEEADDDDNDDESEALKKLLNTPTKAFSQIVFSESVSFSNNQQQSDNHSDDDLPNLSPIKPVSSESQHLDESSDRNKESRQNTSTPELEASDDSNNATNSCDEENNVADNNNVIPSIRKVADNQVFLSPETSISRVKNYVINLPSPSKDDLNDSIDSEASSRSRLSSRQSEALSAANRYNSSGIFYGAPLPGPNSTCPFPSDWTFHSIPETIENNSEVD